MTAIEQAEQLRKHAIDILLAERQHIDEVLNIMGHEKTPTSLKRRGRPRKVIESVQQPSHSETIGEVVPLPR
jgi:hypothetical protein